MQKIKFFFPYFLSLSLLLISCKSSQKSTEVVFWSVDQFGQAVSNAKITIGDEEKETNQEGMCFFTLASDNQNIKLKADRNGFLFLGPEEIFIERAKNIDYILSFLRSSKISIRTWKRSWNAETERRNRRERFGGVEISFEGKEYKTDDTGRLDLYLEGEKEGSLKIAAQAYGPNLKTQRSEKTINFKKDIFEYAEDFEFLENRPPDTTKRQVGRQSTTARLAVTTGKIKHTISGVSGGNATTPWEKHIFDSVPVSTRLITIEVLNRDPARITLNLQPDCSDSLALDFNTRIIERWRKRSGQSYRQINSHETF